MTNKIVNHKNIVTCLEKYWNENKTSNSKIYRGLDECPSFLKDLRKVQQDAKRIGLEIEFYQEGSFPSDLVIVESKAEHLDKTSDPSAKREKAKTKKTSYYTLFIAMSSTKSLDAENLYGKPYKKIKRRLIFYLYYFSRIVEPRRFRIINIFPKAVTIPQGFRKFCADNGFGISFIDIEDNNYIVEIKPKSLSELIQNQFIKYIHDPNNLGETLDKIKKNIDKNGSGNLKKAVINEAKDFVLFIEQYIIDTTDAIAGIKLSDFGRRYLDKNLLFQMYDLKKISYRDTIIELVNEHLDEHMDDYQFVAEALSILWEKKLNMQYSTFLETYEPALLHVFAEVQHERFYRDHYIHQFQVFLLGLQFIDCFYDLFIRYTKPEISWLIAATFHDMAYPVQTLDKWMDKFFQEAFLADKIGHIELESHFVKQGFLRSFNYIMEQFCVEIMKQQFCSDWLAKEDGVLQCFFDRITGQKKQHCLLSSISLLKLVYEKYSTEIKVDNIEFEKIYREIIVPSALAIALHDYDVWHVLSTDDWTTRGKCPVPSLEFESDPLSFLLIFCDAVQEWGRPHLKNEEKIIVNSKKENRGKSEKGKRKDEDEKEDKELSSIFRLKNIKCNRNDGLQVTLYSPKHNRTDQRFIDKIKELEALKNFLVQPDDIEFSILLYDKNLKDKPLQFSMTGPNKSISSSILT